MVVFMCTCCVSFRVAHSPAVTSGTIRFVALLESVPLVSLSRFGLSIPLFSLHTALVSKSLALSSLAQACLLLMFGTSL